jgi:anti-sigma factor ChrR (cupin superfamily)
MANLDTRLIEYALGILDQDTRAVMKGELEASVENRQRLSELEELLATLALTVEPVSPSRRVRDQMLASLNPETRFEAYVDRLAKLFDLKLRRIRELLDALASVPGTSWEANEIPGVHLLHFDGGRRVAGADCGLIHVAPGREFPVHRHLGDEWVSVLQGLAREDSGRIFRPGDLIHRAPGTTHTFRTSGDEPFVFAVVLFEGLEWVSDPRDNAGESADQGRAV